MRTVYGVQGSAGEVVRRFEMAMQPARVALFSFGDRFDFGLDSPTLGSRHEWLH